MAGLTRTPASMIRALGASNQTDVVVKNERLEVTEPLETDISEIASGYFDSQQGILVLTFYNDSVMKINGFATTSSLPTGPTGPQGLPGKDGKNGKNGKDGAKGAEGCQGPQGEQGARGATGPTGNTGAQGPQGVRGCPGPKGAPGEVGPTGPQGAIGPTGPRGATGPQGRPGAAGPAGSANIVISTTDPGGVGAGWLWVNPSATTLPPSSTNPSTGGTGTEVEDPDPNTVQWP